MNSLKKFLLLANACLLILFVPSRAFAQSSFVDFSHHIPIFSVGAAGSDGSDSPAVFQMLGYGFTLFDLGRLRTGGVEASLISKSYIFETTAPSGITVRERDAYLGIGLIVPATVDLVQDDDGNGVTLRVGVGYGLFHQRKLSKIILVGLGVRF